MSDPVPKTRGTRRLPARPQTFAAALAVCLALTPRPAAAQSSIGIYSDVSGSSCSLSDNGQGFINGYVVVRPGQEGVSAAQFSAPPPPCFTGTYVGDQQAPGTLVLGNSQTGVSVSLLVCSATPTHVLTIQYFGYGTTPACCEYPVLPDPAASRVTIVDCFYGESEATVHSALFNADGSCPCGGNSPPWPPTDPVPAHSTGDVPLNQHLFWSASDPDDNIADFTLYFGTDPSPPLVAGELMGSEYDPGPLDPLTTYYWRVVVRDVLGLETGGDTWRFSTRALNSPPTAPRLPIPADGASDRPVQLTLEWTATDIDYDPLTYDVYFGASPGPPLVAAGREFADYTPAMLSFATTYHWRVVARDPHGHETSGPEWSFTTRPENYPPNLPTTPSPNAGATSVPVTAVLTWAGSDPDGDALTYDVYLGATNPPPLAAGGLTSASYAPALDYATQYFWRVVVRDVHGAERVGPVWSFTTRLENYPPLVPSAPSPSHNATNRAITTVLAWQCSDPDGEPVTYDVYFGTGASPPLIASDVMLKSYSPGLLAYETQYRWRIVARDIRGAETSGPVWTFTTQPNPVPGSIGIYSDLAGNNCSLTDAGSGMMEAYVVARPGPAGFYAVEFSAPQPACFTGAYLGDQTVAGSLVIGNSQTGISVTLQECTNDPAHVLTIQYLTYGTTPACCEYPILADPTVDVLAMVDCAFNVTSLNVSLARLNADVTCPCGSNFPPVKPSVPVPPNASTGRPRTQTLAWQCVDPNGDPLRFSVYFGIQNPPPLAADSITTTAWDPGLLASGTTYYWRVRARDPYGLFALGDVWSFTTKVNTPPEPPRVPSPYHGDYVLPPQVMTWSCSDADGDALTYDLYLGTDPDPPLVASGLTSRSYVPGALPPVTRYYWRVVASDGQSTSSSMVWYFDVLMMGDPDYDGQVTLADAQCTFGMSLYEGCGVPDGHLAADVDCSGWPLTPRDARCIHKHVLDGSCEFCEPHGEPVPPPVYSPVVTQGSTWEYNDTLVVELNVSGVPSLQSFWFALVDESDYHPGTFIRAERRGASAAWTAVRGNGGSSHAFVGGYTVGSNPAVSSVPFVRLLYIMPQCCNLQLRVYGYADDLSGAAPLVIYRSGGGIPVLISRFEARVSGDHVALSWELGGDEVAERFSVLRREGNDGRLAVVGEGEATGSAGSWTDAGVEPATTYHYELVLRTPGGNEFRSQMVTVTTGAVALALGQNHPNPFNPTTVIPYTLPGGASTTRVRLLVMDVSGKLVRTLVDEPRPGGVHEAIWDGKDDRGGPVSSGVYFYVLDADGKRQTRKLVLLK